MSEFLQSDFFRYIGIPILICLARIIDVTLGTVRIILVSKGKKIIAPILGFFEILIWLIAITQVMAHLDGWQNYIAYALGFALGNLFGILLEEKLALGHVVVRIIPKIKAVNLAKMLRNSGYSVSMINANGNDGDINILFVVIKRCEIDNILPLIKENNPWAFYTIEDLRYANLNMINVPVNQSTIKEFSKNSI
ncbi:Uncharacterized protein conserved in bacteria (DUF2179) [Campylobacter sputorum subsp. bubulus]|uniref:UPF0316 protein NCTC12475_01614 n=1 Tax=Campylobacter sputorum subsp. sputorum TaxID=32024 RepID=A0A381DL32_9BACT|nr:DUF2179 domain-containing protein [Campylobacter sputorum]ASM34712.1 DUF2179 domain protein [Campylobacter sputorum aubsp. sputorum RM3237]ASM36373.1 DUF2179 domain protein [Campylobacter sputorum bv. faecalis CCUG 20703]KAB0581726.1 DUF2179 domain-containing protein [Campylobacter sputorum subsp. sputorum]QEL04903.1 DUF2179 domain-containing membrane protein [Campylobacter sputorum subsp. sputorum]SUX09972.1 Uncharacterized protein conserved in bacteria (DUF2179) [Campylobacter sputorum su